MVRPMPLEMAATLEAIKAKSIGVVPSVEHPEGNFGGFPTYLSVCKNCPDPKCPHTQVVYTATKDDYPECCSLQTLAFWWDATDLDTLLQATANKDSEYQTQLNEAKKLLKKILALAAKGKLIEAFQIWEESTNPALEDAFDELPDNQLTQSLSEYMNFVYSEAYGLFVEFAQHKRNMEWLKSRLEGEDVNICKFVETHLDDIEEILAQIQEAAGMEIDFSAVPADQAVAEPSLFVTTNPLVDPKKRGNGYKM